MTRMDMTRASAWLSLLQALLVMVVLGLASAHAQVKSPDLVQIDALFQSTEAALEKGNSTKAYLEEVRPKIAAYRETLSAFVERGSVEARAVQAQLDALGPAPADGSAEPQALASRREQLTQSLAVVNAPLVAAQGALKRAEVLIKELDSQIWSYDAREVLTKYPAPVFPNVWSAAAADLKRILSALDTEVKELVKQPSVTAQVKEMLPTAALFGLFGLALLFGVLPVTARRLRRAAQSRGVGARRIVLLTLFHLSMLLLPYAGAMALILTLPVLGLVPASANALPEVVLGIAGLLVAANWLAVVVFSPADPSLRLVDLDDAKAKSAALTGRLLGLTLSVQVLVAALEKAYRFAESTSAVVSLPIIACAALLLSRMAGLLLAAKTAEEGLPSKSAATGFRHFLARAMQVVAGLSLVAALLGYVFLSNAVINPMILTLGEIGLGLFLYAAILALIGTAAGRGAQTDHMDTSLLPVGIILLLVLAFSPLLAITWGAHVSDVAEIWRTATNGVVVGGVHLSLDGVIALAVVLALGLILTRWLQSLLRAAILPRTRLDAGAQSALNKGVGYLGVTVSALLAATAAGLDLSNLAVVVGALSVGIGLGLQNIVSNFVSGIILLIERPIKEGDWIEVAGQSGIVRKIDVRSTRIETFDRHDVIVPNLDLISGTVKNLTLTTVSGRLILPIGVAYDSDVNEGAPDPAGGRCCPADDPAARRLPWCCLRALAQNALDFELTCFLQDEAQKPAIRSELLFAIHAAFKTVGIQIPFPQRDIQLRDLDKILKALDLSERGAAPKGRGLDRLIRAALARKGCGPVTTGSRPTRPSFGPKSQRRPRPPACCPSRSRGNR